MNRINKQNKKNQALNNSPAPALTHFFIHIFCDLTIYKQTVLKNAIFFVKI